MSVGFQVSVKMYKWTSVSCECLFNKLFLSRQSVFWGYSVIKDGKMMAIPTKLAINFYMVVQIRYSFIETYNGKKV